jgi:NAD(P)H-flavin reductase
MNNPLPVPAVISSVLPMTPDTTLFTLLTEPGKTVARSFLPGQFLELSLPGVGEIPVSYCGYRSRDGSIELCIRHVGHVTTPLKAAVAGDEVGVRGPYGRGFPMSDYRGLDLLLVAGGLGMAPLRSLLLALLAERDLYRRITVLLGAREAGLLLFLEELLVLKKRGEIELLLAVDRSSHASEKLADCQVALLPSLLYQLHTDPEQTSAAICGPSVAYPHLVTALQALGLTDDHVHLSLERRMKCGIGRCGHCAVGSHLCCVDGPVFSVEELSGIEGALG